MQSTQTRKLKNEVICFHNEQELKDTKFMMKLKLMKVSKSIGLAMDKKFKITQ